MLQSECGYTPDEIREMTMLDVQRLSNHWRRHPPLRGLVRAIAMSLGVEFKSPDDKPKPMTGAEFARMVAQTNGGQAWTLPNG